MAEVAMLLTSELVTNAIVHAQSPLTVAVALENQRVRVAVSDQSDSIPVRSKTTPSDESGRGLQLVDALARSWGVEPAAGGKAVWFELART
jgi:anti-sigma regulatory factor (Ser/Thr protein kinase)